jgi:hypothetical protein
MDFGSYIVLQIWLHGKTVQVKKIIQAYLIMFNLNAESFVVEREQRLLEKILQLCFRNMNITQVQFARLTI